MSTIFSGFTDRISAENLRISAENLKDPLYRNSFFMAFTNFFNAGCGFLFWIIAARFYTVEEVGLATAMISYLGLVILFSRLGFDFAIIRFFPQNDKARILNLSLVVTTVASLLVGTVYIVLVGFLSPALAFLKKPEYALIFLLIGAFNSVAVMAGRAFIADRMADKYLFQNIFLALRIPLLIPLAFLGAFGIFGSVGISFFVASFFALIALQRNLGAIKVEVDMDFIRKSFSFSSWNYLSSILFSVPDLVLPIMVLNMFGGADAAKYYIASAIGQLVLIIPNSVGISLFVEGSHGQSLKKSVLRALSITYVLLVPAVLVMCLIGKRLLGLLKGEYVDAFDLLVVLALSSFFVSIYALFIAFQNIRMKAKSVMKLNAVSCTLLLGLSYLLMQQYGILGVGYGWIITYGVIVVWIGWMVRRERWS